MAGYGKRTKDAADELRQEREQTRWERLEAAWIAEEPRWERLHQDLRDLAGERFDVDLKSGGRGIVTGAHAAQGWMCAAIEAGKDGGRYAVQAAARFGWSPHDEFRERAQILFRCMRDGVAVIAGWCQR